MEKNKELRDWLNLLIRPGFYVEEGRITQVNAAAFLWQIRQPIRGTGND